MAKIYNEAGKEIGKTCFSDEMQYNAFGDIPTFWHRYSECWGYTSHGVGNKKPEKCSEAFVTKEEYEKFRYFKNNKATLSFEDYDENTVVLSTDIIKKIVINVEDSWEEQVQVYKEITEEVEVEVEVEVEENSPKETV